MSKAIVIECAHAQFPQQLSRKNKKSISIKTCQTNNAAVYAIIYSINEYADIATPSAAIEIPSVALRIF